jgi:uncharacterized protein (DUF2384 family)
MAHSSPARSSEELLANAEQVAAIAIKAFARIAAAWRLTNEEASELAGVSARTWARMKAGEWSGSLSQDQELRLSALVGLYKALHVFFSDTLANQWVGFANSGPPFLGRKPTDFMRDGGVPAILATRDYVDALRGGL